ncbi:MAG: hypothetical protein DWQ01_07615 [Planctomycetota bacterium]|nr:MAG: hypothetical protein DWQ01_07615 [Planctomycetota bacterium]
MSDPQTTIKFFDGESKEDAWVIVRQCVDGTIGLCTFLRSHGEVEVFLDRKSAEKVRQALEDTLDSML